VLIFLNTIVTCVRFPWQRDVGTLSRNNGIVQLLQSLDTQQYWTALASLADNNVNKQHCYAHNNRQAFPRSQDCCLRTSKDIFSVCWNSLECRRVCIWLRTPFGWKTKFVSGNCERSTWVYTVDGQDIRSSGLLNGRLMMDYTPSAIVVCKWTNSPTMDCPDVCLEAFWLQEWEWVLEGCHKRSCWKNSIGVSVPRPYRSDVYVCSKSCWLWLTVVSCVLGPEETGRTRCVLSATVCN
jgi:hypothetical protein